MSKQQYQTKILFVESDERSFQFRECIANVLTSLPPIKLLYAADADQALTIIGEYGVDVVVIEDELLSELEVIVDSLSDNRPSIILQTDDGEPAAIATPESDITCLPKEESLAAIHQTLVIASNLGAKSPTQETLDSLH